MCYTGFLDTKTMLVIATKRTEEDAKRDLPTIAFKYPPIGWIPTFKESKSELELTFSTLSTLGEYYPKNVDVFKAFDKCPLNSVRVVIIGQDPYHSTYNGQPQANGMCFSTNKGCPVQPSLKNIYKELQREYPKYVIPEHGDLSYWAKQGVLLLNTCLTVAPSKPKSHIGKGNIGIWGGFMARVFKAISETNSECIYLLWGKPAHDLERSLGERSIKLKASHPSPFSVWRDGRDCPAFNKCDHFKKVNELLESKGEKPIDWQIK